MYIYVEDIKSNQDINPPQRPFIGWIRLKRPTQFTSSVLLYHVWRIKQVHGPWGSIPNRQQIIGYFATHFTPDDSQRLAARPFTLLQGKWQQSITAVLIYSQAISCEQLEAAGIICLCPLFTNSGAWNLCQSENLFHVFLKEDKEDKACTCRIVLISSITAKKAFIVTFHIQNER